MTKHAVVIVGAGPTGLMFAGELALARVDVALVERREAQTALGRGDARTDALRENIAELLGLDEPRQRYGAMMSGLDIHHDLGAGHPLLGRRMPDLDLITVDGPQPVFSLLHDARPIRPDGHVAWLSDGTERRLLDARTRSSECDVLVRAARLGAVIGSWYALGATSCDVWSNDHDTKKHDLSLVQQGRGTGGALLRCHLSE